MQARLMATILPVQCWIAGAVLGWSPRKLAKVANVLAGAVARFEGEAVLKAGTVEAIQCALEMAGVDFISRH
jgi:hypothetical protein